MSQETKDEPGRSEITIADLLLSSFHVFAGYAWQRMGVMPRHDASSVREDLSEARAAIDACGRLLEFMDPHVDDETRRMVQSTVSNLRIYYVRKVDSKGSKP